MEGLKNVVAKSHVVRLSPKKLSVTDRGRIQALQEGEKFYFSSSEGRYELCQALYSRSAVTQNFGSKVVTYREMDSLKMQLELNVRRLPNISLGASGLERFLHPTTEFKNPIGAFRSLESMFEDYVMGEAFELYFNEKPEVAGTINQMGGIAYLEGMHFEGDHRSDFVETLRKSYKRYCYLKSVSRYE